MREGDEKFVYNIFKRNINLLVIIIIFIIICCGYIITLPVFEAPDEPGHFLYAFYISKYNRIPSYYEEPVSEIDYIKENIDKDTNAVFYMDEKYMFYKWPWTNNRYSSQRHHPPLYYLISSQIIKPFKVNDIYIEDNYENFREPGVYNSFINNKILEDWSPTIKLVLSLRLFQILYGIGIIIFLFKIIKLITGDKLKDNSIFLISSVAFLPQFVFLCSYINNDLPAALFGLISVYFSVLLFKREKIYFGVLSILFAIIASLTKLNLLIMIPIAVVTFFVWLILEKKTLQILLLFSILLLGAVAIFYIFFRLELSSTYFEKYFIPVIRGTILKFRDNFSLDRYKASVLIAFKSSVAFFGWMNIPVHNFVYYFYLAFIISGILLFFSNVKKFRNNYKILAFISVTIVLIFIFFSVYMVYSGYTQHMGRVIFLAVILVFLLAILGYLNLKNSFRRLFCYGIFSYFVLINLFCLYNYIFKSYY